MRYLDFCFLRWQKIELHAIGIEAICIITALAMCRDITSTFLVQEKSSLSVCIEKSKNHMITMHYNNFKKIVRMLEYRLMYTSLTCADWEVVNGYG